MDFNTNQKHGVIYADPPWTFKTYSNKGKDKSPERHYPCMSLADIVRLPVDRIAKDDAVLLMWVVDPLLDQAFKVIDAWGFKYKTVGFTWAKTNRTKMGFFTGLGYWTRGNPEMCLLATRGKPKRLNKSIPQLVVDQRREHSRKPDIVLVDYADIMKSTQNFTEKRHSIGLIYEELRGIAGEFDIPIWTASQANRSSLEEDVIGADKVSEDYSKVMTADFVMSMSRKVEDKIANTGRFHVIKNRFGPDGLTFPATINTNTGYIQVYEANTQEGRQTQGKMNNSEEYLRKTLAQKKKDFDAGGFE